MFKLWLSCLMSAVPGCGYNSHTMAAWWCSKDPREGMGGGWLSGLRTHASRIGSITPVPKPKPRPGPSMKEWFARKRHET